MSAGVEILLLVVPVCIWIIDWSYCRVIPKDEQLVQVWLCCRQLLMIHSKKAKRQW